MKIIEPSFEILSATHDLEQLIERAGRTCYKSEARITSESSARFIKRLKDSQHESVLEHGAITVRIVCDRGVSHELVRHRLAAYSQESTRYVSYQKREMRFIKPCFWSLADPQFSLWRHACEDAETCYLSLMESGATPQEARSVLPNSLKTEIVMTANPREWLHVFKLRCAPSAHPQMREIMCQIQDEFHKRWPNVFDV